MKRFISTLLVLALVVALLGSMAGAFASEDVPMLIASLSSGEASGEASDEPSGEPSGEIDISASGEPSGEIEIGASGEPSGEIEIGASEEPSGEIEVGASEEPSGEIEVEASGEPSGEASGEIVEEEDGMTEDDLEQFAEFHDIYILEGSDAASLDLASTVSLYDDAVIVDISFDLSEVNLAKAGTYTYTMKLTIDVDAYDYALESLAAVEQAKVDGTSLSAATASMEPAATGATQTVTIVKAAYVMSAEDLAECAAAGIIIQVSDDLGYRVTIAKEDSKQPR